jgi:uncharacterized protein YbbC (DUF1343 family)
MYKKGETIYHRTVFLSRNMLDYQSIRGILCIAEHGYSGNLKSGEAVSVEKDA